jgi:hypothetical protein
MKLTEIKDAITDGVHSVIRHAEHEVGRALYRMKQRVFRFVLALVLFVVSIVFILVGGVLIISNVVPIEWALFLGGLILLLVVLLATRFS